MKRFRLFSVKYCGPTQKTSAKIKIYDSLFDKNKYIKFNDVYYSSVDQIIDFLSNQGFEVLGTEKIKNNDIIICSWTSQEIK